MNTIMRELYVIDTTALISFFDGVFRHSSKYNGSRPLSNRVNRIIREAVFSKRTHIRLSIPTVVFIEIYEKWLIPEEFCRRFFYEVFEPIKATAIIKDTMKSGKKRILV